MEDMLKSFMALKCVDDRFFDMELSDGTLSLRCAEKTPANPEKRYVPAYAFDIMLGGERIGGLSLRLGYVEGLYYGGNIGYNIDEDYRGHGYASRACELLRPLLKAHEMKYVYITNETTNTASRRVCEKLGARLECAADVPEWTELYADGGRKVNVFCWEQ